MELVEVDPWYTNEPAHFDLGMLEWGAHKYREFLAIFEGSLGTDDPPQYSLNLDSNWNDRGVKWRRYRLLTLMLLTLRGRPEVNALFGGDGQEFEKVDYPASNSDSTFLDHLVSLRRNCPALVLGDFRILPTGDEEVFAYVREVEMQRIMVLLNFAGYQMDIELQGSVGIWIAGTHDVFGDGLPPTGGRIVLEPYEGRIYELRKVLA